MFRLSSEAKAYYKKIKDNNTKAPIFHDEWDLYYLSLLLGLANNKRNVKVELLDMFRNFSKKYKDSKDSIITLLIIAHAKKRKLDISNKTTLESILHKFYGDIESVSGITEEGIKEMNYYAAGGFEIIEEMVPTYTNSNSGAVIKKIYNKLKKSMDAFADNNT